MLCYLLFDVRPEPGKTLNAIVLSRFAGSWHIGRMSVGTGFVVTSLVAEAALLFVAAQAGFIDGPRVMANMARDHWLPHRFSQLSERLTVQDGVLLMGGAAIVTLMYSRGDITTLVTMYSINIFVTFSLSQLGMVRYWITRRRREAHWGRGLIINGIAFFMCAGLLAGIVYEKAERGGWVTMVATSGVVALLHLGYRRARGQRAWTWSDVELELDSPLLRLYALVFPLLLGLARFDRGLRGEKSSLVATAVRRH